MTQPIPQAFEYTPAPRERVFEFWSERNVRTVVRASSVSVIHGQLMFRTGAFVVLATGTAGPDWKSLREIPDPERYLTADGLCALAGDHAAHGIYTSSGTTWCMDRDPNWSRIAGRFAGSVDQ